MGCGYLRPLDAVADLAVLAALNLPTDREPKDEEIQASVDMIADDYGLDETYRRMLGGKTRAVLAKVRDRIRAARAREARRAKSKSRRR